MSFPRYQEYLDSGVEWLGKVPAHWTVASLARVTVEKCDGPFGSGLKSEHYVDSGVRVVRLQNIRHGIFDGSDEAFIDETYFRGELARHEVKAGDLLIAGLGDERNTVGRACVAPTTIEPAIVKADCFRFRIDRSVAEPEFLASQLSAGSAADAGLLTSGSTRQRITLSVMASRTVALPPIPEQQAIIGFLRLEANKIDALIAEQQWLIGLLAEKRQAVISHTVTKGLNPDVPTKASGVEWLGDVPRHWQVLPLKRVATVRTGVAKGKDLRGVDTISVPYLRVANVQDGYLALEEVKEIEIPASDLDRYRLRRGDVLMNEGGDFDKLGRGCVWTGAIDPCITQNHVFAVRPTRVAPDWLSLITQSSYAQFYFMQRSKQSTNLASISSTNLLELPVVLPPEGEQQAIREFIQAQICSAELLRVSAQRAIALLQERRTALISAAVTGKIDVRGLVDAEAVAA